MTSAGFSLFPFFKIKQKHYSNVCSEKKHLISQFLPNLEDPNLKILGSLVSLFTVVLTEVCLTVKCVLVMFGVNKPGFLGSRQLDFDILVTLRSFKVWKKDSVYIF